MWIELENGANIPLNKLAREQMKYKILADINVDLMICEIEWWDKKEYIKDLQILLNNLLK